VHPARPAAGLGAGRGEDRRTRRPGRPARDHTSPDPAEGQRRTIIADKAYYGRQFEARLDHNGIDLLRPAALARNPKPQPDCSAPTATHRIGRRHLEGQLDFELPGGRTITGVRVRIARRILALVAAI